MITLNNLITVNSIEPLIASTADMDVLFPQPADISGKEWIEWLRKPYETLKTYEKKKIPISDVDQILSCLGERDEYLEENARKTLFSRKNLDLFFRPLTVRFLHYTIPKEIRGDSVKSGRFLYQQEEEAIRRWKKDVFPENEPRSVKVRSKALQKRMETLSQLAVAVVGPLEASYNLSTRVYLNVEERDQLHIGCAYRDEKCEGEGDGGTVWDEPQVRRDDGAEERAFRSIPRYGYFPLIRIVYSRPGHN